MRAFLIYAATACGLLVATAFQGDGSGRRDPDELLAQAVAQTRSCKYDPEKYTVDEKGGLHKKKPDKQDGKFAQRLSVPLLFKPGRFRLDFGPDTVTSENRRVMVVNFHPVDEAFRLPAGKDENKYLNQAMNELGGSAQIDPATGDFASIHAEFKGKLPFDWHGVKYAELTEAEVNLSQTSITGDWLPAVFDLRVKYWKIPVIKLDVHDKYVAVFDCDGK
ncbi:MAG: hypothetical protein A3J09_01915 [Candidatus Zambryskibacteria bacterium RIFCSPLOWO2_02_FULL_51_21]|uniref:Uncharacterized protein n=1 Tax=Candidatus Zambryskibacteria bacterium RIFCSPHIGHO2_02_FULL_43_37 TaxID=1802749 RepID=A0A1G2THB4_9BACT|nr:MAG: hypothetical protein A2723_01915 [Candidatus Zambryskibacteria bacterium RIFCSPHIGHO2_01_FULL_52_18]OHA96448.1 MAG: hypothetical protein A3D49_00985 [Candidatus Zambryskibacteria bacterium RIFCSPHIGHO2_02_FULL_43_37]OHB11291.1 MAG: hypothetical protein A3J09_01915 [Candidatus Zambryskibacteria bacterium RIFCSPLOWO2_02_FULL_51_21]